MSFCTQRSKGRIEKCFIEINEITGIIIREATTIHRNIGPGLKESAYEELLCYRLVKYHGSGVKRQGKIDLICEDIRMDIDLRYDLKVENKVLVELKSQETVPAVTYKI